LVGGSLAIVVVVFSILLSCIKPLCEVIRCLCCLIYIPRLWRRKGNLTKDYTDMKIHKPRSSRNSRVPNRGWRATNLRRMGIFVVLCSAMIVVVQAGSEVVSLTVSSENCLRTNNGSICTLSA
jgi:hypothetical protein